MPEDTCLDIPERNALAEGQTRWKARARPAHDWLRTRQEERPLGGAVAIGRRAAPGGERSHPARAAGDAAAPALHSKPGAPPRAPGAAVAVPPGRCRPRVFADPGTGPASRLRRAGTFRRLNH